MLNMDNNSKEDQNTNENKNSSYQKEDEICSSEANVDDNDESLLVPLDTEEINIAGEFGNIDGISKLLGEHLFEFSF